MISRFQNFVIQTNTTITQISTNLEVPNKLSEIKIIKKKRSKSTNNTPNNLSNKPCKSNEDHFNSN